MIVNEIIRRGEGEKRKGKRKTKIAVPRKIFKLSQFVKKKEKSRSSRGGRLRLARGVARNVILHYRTAAVAGELIDLSSGYYGISAA